MSEYNVLHDPLLLATLSWGEIEDMYLFNLLRADTADAQSERGDSYVMNASDRNFREWFRFEKVDLEDLADALKIPHEVTSAEGVIVPGDEALCMTVRRLAFPNRLCDLEHISGRRSSVITSVVSKVMAHVEHHFSHLLADLTNHKWLNATNLEQFSAAVHARGAPLKNCWGFVDATARRMLQPPARQQGHLSEEHRGHHVQKYQAVMCANGIVCRLDGPFSARRRDGGILRDTGLYENLQKLSPDAKFALYGGPAYPLWPLLMKPYEGTQLKPQQAMFNKGMDTVMATAEWELGKVARDFASIDLHKDEVLGRMYKVATLFANCYTCLYGNQVSMYFDLEPPALEEYLVPFA